MTEAHAGPKRALSVFDAVAVLAGIVIGVGIFKTPSLVAANTGSTWAFMGAWVLGAVVSLVGALCYAELASAYPHAGGEYHFLHRAFGAPAAFMFAWARLTVIQTGSIALHAFVVGDYATQIVPLGPYSSAVYAAVLVAGLTALNVAGIVPGKWAQRVLVSCVIAGLLLVVAAGFSAGGAGTAAAVPAPVTRNGAFGLAMVFVLLTYGGWNEAAYLSAEVRGGASAIVRVLLYGIGLVAGVYLLVTLAMLHALGQAGMAGSDVVAADVMRKALGENGARLISLLVVVTAIGNMNGTMITGARTNYALGRDLPLLARLGHWDDRAGTPTTALWVQGAIALALVVVGSLARSGFSSMVDYTAPVFWLFFLLVGVSVFVLRAREPGVHRPFRVPLYPVTPLLFCAAAAYMLYASLDYTGRGALVGVGVLFLGVPVMLMSRGGAQAVPQRA
jgi:amino acid transporter